MDRSFITAEERGIPEHLITATLGWCNEQRAIDGKPPLEELPAGRPYNVDSCPCGAATGLMVTRTWAMRGTEMITLPEAVQEFIIRFDRGID